MSTKQQTRVEPLEWVRRARVERTGEFQTRTWTSRDGRWRVQECQISMYSLRSRWWVSSESVGNGGWAPVGRHKSRAAAEAAIAKRLAARGPVRD